MLEHFYEWLASKSEPRFRAYRQARTLYELFTRELQFQFNELTPAQFEKALQDERILEAEQLYKQAIELSFAANAVWDAAVGCYQLGMLLHLKGQFEEAVQFLQKCLQISGDLLQSDPAIISGCYYHLGIIACRRGQIETARQYLNRSLEIDTATHDLQGIQLCKSALNTCDETKPSVFLNINIPVVKNEHPSYPWDQAGNQLPVDLPRTSAANLAEPSSEQRTETPVNTQVYQDVIWILSASEPANDQVTGSIEQIAGQISRKLVIVRAAFGSPDKRKTVLPPLAYDERLAAAILIIEKKGLSDREFRHWSNWCIYQVAARDDFRLFLWLDGLTINELKDYAQIDPLYATLLDTVQYYEDATLEHLRHAVKAYLNKLDQIQLTANWRRIKITTGIFMGKIAKIIQISSGIVLGIMSILMIILGDKTLAASITGNYKILIGIIMSMVLFPLLSIPLYLLFQGFPKMNTLLKSHANIRNWLILGAFLSPASVGISEKIGVPSLWIILGVTLGILLDLTRRSGYQAQRAGLSIQKALELKQTPIMAALAKGITDDKLSPMRLPIFPAHSLKVFISYTGSSSWSTTNAKSLYNILHNQKIATYFDQAAIAEGSNWRSSLNQNMADTNVFIALLDQITVNREWVAAEMSIALASKQFTSLPEIIILVDPNLSLSGNMLPVFESIFREYYKLMAQGYPRLITVKDSTLQTIGVSLGSNRHHSTAVFPSKLAVLFPVISVPMTALGAIAPFFGIPAVIFAYLQYWDKFSLNTILSSVGMLSVIYLICGYWLGFVARLGVASLYEMHVPNRKSLFWIQMLSFIGFTGILVVWFNNVSKLTVGWAFVLAWIGWMLANSFVQRIEKEKNNSIQ